MVWLINHISVHCLALIRPVMFLRGIKLRSGDVGLFSVEFSDRDVQVILTIRVFHLTAPPWSILVLVGGFASRDGVLLCAGLRLRVSETSLCLGASEIDSCTSGSRAYDMCRKPVDLGHTMRQHTAFQHTNRLC